MSISQIIDEFREVFIKEMKYKLANYQKNIYKYVAYIRYWAAKAKLWYGGILALLDRQKDMKVHTCINVLTIKQWNFSSSQLISLNH